jgi:hypothetical protein
MLRISGPEYISVIYVNKTLNVVLLGDEHFSTQGDCIHCNRSKDCKDVVDFLQSLNKPTHILLEAPYASKYAKKDVAKYVSSHPDNDYLRKVVSHFKNHMYGKQGRTRTSNIQAHFVDFRFHPSFKLLRHTHLALESKKANYIPYVQSVLLDFKSGNTFKHFIDACLTADDFVKAIEDIFGERSAVYSDKEHLTSQGDKHNIHRLRKQMLKLSPSSQYAIKRFHKHASKDIIEDYYNHEYKKVRRQLLLQDTYDDIDIIVLIVSIQKWLSHIMDLYVISRMLYIIESRKTQTIVCYAGSNHAFMYQLFFEKFMRKNMTKLRWECNKAYGLTQKQEKQKRCVTIPLEIAKELME